MLRESEEAQGATRLVGHVGALRSVETPPHLAFVIDEEIDDRLLSISAGISA
jgi:hypothetical protein